MRRSVHRLLPVVLTGLLLACGAAEDGTDGGKSRIAGLIDKLHGLLASEPQSPGDASPPDTPRARPGQPSPIVRCEVGGKVRFTNESLCEHGGGRGELVVFDEK